MSVVVFFNLVLAVLLFPVLPHPIYYMIIAPFILGIANICFANNLLGASRPAFWPLALRAAIFGVVIFAGNVFLVLRSSGQVGYGDELRFGDGVITLKGYLELLRVSAVVAAIVFASALLAALLKRQKMRSPER